MKQNLKSMLLYLHRNFYTRIFPDLVKELEKELKGCKSVLDVGCGSNSPIRFFSKNIYSEGMDIFLPSIEKSREKKIHNRYHQTNVLDIGKKFKKDSFDCVVALDLIEHLEKSDGLRLIKEMENIARNKIIILTPNGFLPHEEYDGNKYEAHKSGWNEKEMKDLGYKVTGINGIKFLRGDFARIKFQPKYFWWVASDMTQLFVRKRPEKAFQILCVKKKETKHEN